MGSMRARARELGMSPEDVEKFASEVRAFDSARSDNTRSRAALEKIAKSLLDARPSGTDARREEARRDSVVNSLEILAAGTILEYGHDEVRHARATMLYRTIPNGTETN